ncbi:MAG: toll/interleukin-1 receptor domain-containing protein [Longimicrobiaceae bacterium]
MWDVFISHASEDKEKIAAPLADELRRRGLRIWYDDFSLELGDSLRRSIDAGLAQSRFGVIILSPRFFAKHWPQRELDGLTSREISGEKVILPVWHGVTHTEVAVHSPLLADRLAVSTDRSIAQVADVIEQVVRRGGSAAETPQRARARTRVLESRRTKLFLLALGLVAVLALVIFVVIMRRPGTASTELPDWQAADTSHAIVRPPPSPASTSTFSSSLIEHFHAEKNIGWASFYLGMAQTEADSYVGGLTITTGYDEIAEQTACYSEFVYNGVNVRLEYASHSGPPECTNPITLYVATIFVSFTPVEASMSKEDLVRSLKNQLPGLRYTPGFHDPQRTEADNDKPIYTLGETGTYRIIVDWTEHQFIVADRNWGD